MMSKSLCWFQGFPTPYKIDYFFSLFFFCTNSRFFVFSFAQTEIKTADFTNYSISNPKHIRSTHVNSIITDIQCLYKTVSFEWESRHCTVTSHTQPRTFNNLSSIWFSSPCTYTNIKTRAVLILHNTYDTNNKLCVAPACDVKSKNWISIYNEGDAALMQTLTDGHSAKVFSSKSADES
jgi:hypothetical protein